MRLTSLSVSIHGSIAKERQLDATIQRKRRNSAKRICLYREVFHTVFKADLSSFIIALVFQLLVSRRLSDYVGSILCLQERAVSKMCVMGR